MTGTKAETLAGVGAGRGLAFLRHDYSGHGESGGDFADGTISQLARRKPRRVPSLHVGRQILVGSSMGAWIALRMVAGTAQGRAGRPHWRAWC